MKILSIETSCDETAASIINAKQVGAKHVISVISNIVSSQIDIHKKYGGVVPEIAAREHVLNILPVINEAFKKSKLHKKNINAIAVTLGPGLITSLLVGIETAKTLSYAWNIPAIGINHIEGHIYANFISEISKHKYIVPNIQFPAIALTVSGGHTMLILIKNHGKYETIGATLDDAAGEAFDKAAQLLNLGYPGGPEISKQAEIYKKTILKSTNQKLKIILPRPMINKQNFNFSFSGLKTALLYAIKKDKDYKSKIPNYAYEFQQAIIDTLINKTIKATQQYNIKTVLLAGGVSANKELRKQLKNAIKKQIPNSKLQIPNLKYTTDNAAMIATAGYFHAIRKNFTPWDQLKVNCNLEL